MANNEEKNESEILEETMQNLNLDGDEKDTKEQELSDEDIASLLEEDKPEELLEELTIKEDDNLEELVEEEPQKTQEPEPKEEKVEEITEVDDINLNNNDQDAAALDSEVQEEIPKEATQKKQSKLVKILIIVAAVLLTLVSTGAVLFLLGFFDPEPVVEEMMENNSTQQQEYEFKEEDIDQNRLNDKLNLLTKYEIVEGPETEAKKAAEKEKLYNEAKKQLEAERQERIERIKEAERKRIEEELPPVVNNDNITEQIDEEINNVIESTETKMEETNTSKIVNDTNMTKTEEMVPIVEANQDEMTQNEETIEQETIQPVNDSPSFIKVLKINTNSEVIYKNYLDNIYSITDDITLCRDFENRIEIFVGPFEEESDRRNIALQYKNRFNLDVEISDYTLEEYDQRCNY